ncbi:MAG: alpha/beta fold hydrolase [Planctomycetia bacterium]|nr:alpha/beta fold hydrolase [Planctomycetia bacterium]
MGQELVDATAGDGLRLDGALHLPQSEQATDGSGFGLSGFDAALIIHGTGSNFYGSRFLTYIAQRFTARGLAALVVNTRGHDQICSALVRNPDGSTGSRTIGSAYERVDECRLDLAAWCQLLAERGYRRIALVGHSLGAVKCVYAAVHGPLPGIAAVVVVSPPRLSYSHFAASVRAPGFLEELATAERHIAAGEPDALMQIRFPLPYVITASGYLEKYGPSEQYNLLRYLDRLALPTLFTFGSQEVMQGIAFRGFPEALQEAKDQGAKLHIAVIAGGDHHYTGVQGALLDSIERWLGKLS